MIYFLKDPPFIQLNCTKGYGLAWFYMLLKFWTQVQRCIAVNGLNFNDQTGTFHTKILPLLEIVSWLSFQALFRICDLGYKPNKEDFKYSFLMSTSQGHLLFHTPCNYYRKPEMICNISKISTELACVTPGSRVVLQINCQVAPHNLSLSWLFLPIKWGWCLPSSGEDPSE